MGSIKVILGLNCLIALVDILKSLLYLAEIVTLIVYFGLSGLIMSIFLIVGN